MGERLDTVLARHPDELTEAWAQRVVALSRPDVRVSRAEVLSVDVGTTTRVRLAVEHDDPGFPHRWFAKLPSLSRRARWITAMPRLLQTEARFYREVARVVPVLHPSMLAGQTRLGWGATLVLEDVTESGAVAGAPGDAWTAQQAGLAVDELARLHALLWEHPDLDRVYHWLGGRVRRLEDALGAALAVPLMKRGLLRAGDAIPGTLHAPALRFARQRRRWMCLLADGPRTLVHHDVHPGNLFWRAGRPGLLDWHLVRVGEGVGDVAYFLANALLPEVRREHEKGLLARYRAGLLAAGVAAPALDVLDQRYRVHLVYPFEAMVVTLAVGGMMDLAANLELVRRTAIAVADHEAFAAGPDRCRLGRLRPQPPAA
jgi:hypothetical protein